MDRTRLRDIFHHLSEMDYIKPDDIPAIALYMDQVTTFMDAHLAHAKRYEDDKILTKTMINNYAKNDLLPPPEKKKYSREHMLLLLFIYYYKGFLSISDIQTLLKPLEDRYFTAKDGIDLETIYSEVFSLEKDAMDQLMKDVFSKFQAAGKTFQDALPEEQEMLQTFSFICALGFDVYLKKQMIERLIDQMRKGGPDFPNKDQKKK